MKQKETIDYYLKVVWQSVSNSYNRIASGYGLTQAVGYVLINVEANGTAVSALAALLGVKNTSLSRILVSMEKQDLIYRASGVGDGRTVKVFLTPFGIEKRKVARDVVVSFNEYLNNKISTEEKVALILSLEKLNRLTLAYSKKKS